MSKIVTIHQPDLMPWLGFFVKLYRSDTFIVLDHTVNNIKDSSWFRRVKINFSGKESWMSLPIYKSELGSFQKLADMKILDDKSSRSLFDKYLKSFEQTYSKTPFYIRYCNLFSNYFTSENNSLIERNMNFINDVLSILRIDVEIIYSSKLDPHGSSNELLIDMLKKINADIYLSGDGADGYQNNNMFSQAGITTIKNSFIPKPYVQQQGHFMPGLSIIDAFMNLGAKGVKSLIESYGKLDI